MSDFSFNLALFLHVTTIRRWETNAALKWIHFFKSSGVPILICLSHADKLYASTCIGDDGTEICSKDNARRLIQQELEVVHYYHFKCTCNSRSCKLKLH